MNEIYKTKFGYDVFFITALFLTASLCRGQSFREEFRFGEFESATSFHLNNAGFLYITDEGTNELYMYSFAGEPIQSTGGYGWETESFDDPVDVFANTLNVYVTDKNNGRVQIFDRKLNFLSVIMRLSDDGEEALYYPQATEVSGTGEIFILESDNNRILKFDLKGNYITDIGNQEAGQFTLESPTDFALTEDSKLLVCDSDLLKVFDRFGNGLQKIKLDFAPDKISVYGNIALINNSERISTLRIGENFITDKKELTLPKLKDIKEAALYKEKLLILTAREVVVYKLLKNLF